MSEPTPDQSRCDVGDHQRCSGYTEDERDPETCMCSCHDPDDPEEGLGWGMTDRPYPVLAAGTAAGGTDPQFVGGSGARRIIAEERAAGRWADQPPGHAFARATNGRPHRNDGQRLSVPEAGSLQGFPADYPWHGGRGEAAQQIANAVPPPMAARLIDFLTSED